MGLKPTPMSIFDGPNGESLFPQPVLQLFRHNPLPDLFQKAEQSDDRLMTILTALVAESCLDRCLGAFMPQYSKLTETRECTFSAKIRTLQALDFLPRLIPSSVNEIRRARNEFAHDLDLTTFDSLPSGIKQSLIALRAEIYGRFGPKERKPKESLYSLSLAIRRHQSNFEMASGSIAILRES